MPKKKPESPVRLKKARGSKAWVDATTVIAMFSMHAAGLRMRGATAEADAVDRAVKSVRDVLRSKGAIE